MDMKVSGILGCHVCAHTVLSRDLSLESVVSLHLADGSTTAGY